MWLFSFWRNQLPCLPKTRTKFLLVLRFLQNIEYLPTRPQHLTCYLTVSLFLLYLGKTNVFEVKRTAMLCQSFLRNKQVVSQKLRKLRRDIDIRSRVSFQIVLLQICLLKFATATERVGDLEMKFIVWFSQSNKVLKYWSLIQG